MVRKKVKKSPARSKKSSKTKEAVAGDSVMEVGDLESLLREMIGEALAQKDAPQRGETSAPDKGKSEVMVGFAGQVGGNESAPSPTAKLLTLPEELQALHERMMVDFAPEMQAIEKRFGYSSYYKALALYHLRYAVRNMAALVAPNDPRRFSGQPVWWDSNDDESIAESLYSRLYSEISNLRLLAKVRTPEAFDANQFYACYPATNS